ncbi:unnamed protein product [Sphenostylis stenocarpa]|uniref:Pectinesterase n=1 Tax=Sphenostylis stenocarpa TaxID=92480 RepID=A0AA86S513_9FABA|nr:unnamed protein product [Sphenostylis stenocarpa]
MDIKRVAARVRARSCGVRQAVVLRATKTLYTSKPTRQFYRSCIVSGTIDFIFGDAAVVFQNCIMVVRKPNDNQREHGQDRELPWKAMEGVLKNHCDGIEIGDFIHPDGWTAWNGDFALKTLYYAEYGNTGPGATTNMRQGVRHGELVLRETNNERLRKSLESKVHKKDHSSQTRKVNFVIYVVNALLIVNVMNDSSDSETDYIETIVSTFNYPSLSFKDDKPVLVFTHGDLLSRTERAHVRGRLGKLLGIPPTKQIFDIPNSDCPATESAIIGMLRYSLAYADINLPQKCKVLGYKVHKFFFTSIHDFPDSGDRSCNWYGTKSRSTRSIFKNKISQ